MSGAVGTGGPAPTGDPLDVIVSLLRPQAVLSKVVSATGDWSIRKPRYDGPSFCLMLDGRCWLDADGMGPLELCPGDFLLLPSTPGFVMTCDLSLDPIDVALAHVGDTHYGRVDGDARMRMLGGYFRFDRANSKLLVRLLPARVLIPRGEPGAARLGQIVDLISDEATARRPSRELVLERLVEVLLIEACRLRSERPQAGEQGMIAGLADRRLAAVLHAIHTDIAAGWTIERLAHTATMSRAAFAQRFGRTIGMPPMRYVTEWRVALAKDLMRDERPSMSEVANRVGYQSASAFTTAFTRIVGCSPRDYLRECGQENHLAILDGLPQL